MNQNSHGWWHRYATYFVDGCASGTCLDGRSPAQLLPIVIPRWCAYTPTVEPLHYDRVISRKGYQQVRLLDNGPFEDGREVEVQGVRFRLKTINIQPNGTKPPEMIQAWLTSANDYLRLLHRTPWRSSRNTPANTCASSTAMSTLS